MIELAPSYAARLLANKLAELELSNALLVEKIMKLQEEIDRLKSIPAKVEP